MEKSCIILPSLGFCTKGFEKVVWGLLLFCGGFLGSSLAWAAPSPKGVLSSPKHTQQWQTSHVSRKRLLARRSSHGHGRLSLADDLASSDAKKRKRTIRFLRSLKAGAAPMLLTVLPSKKRKAHVTALRFFRTLGAKGKGVLPKLEKHARSFYLLESWTSFMIMASIGDASWPQFQKLLKSKHSHIRGYATIALGFLRTTQKKRLIQALLQMGKDKHKRVRFHAYQALEKRVKDWKPYEKQLLGLLSEKDYRNKIKLKNVLKRFSNPSTAFLFRARWKSYVPQKWWKNNLRKRLRVMKGAEIKLFGKLIRAKKNHRVTPYSLLVRASATNKRLVPLIVELFQVKDVSFRRSFFSGYWRYKYTKSGHYPRHLWKDGRFQKAILGLLKDPDRMVRERVLRYANGHLFMKDAWVNGVWSYLEAKYNKRKLLPIQKLRRFKAIPGKLWPYLGEELKKHVPTKIAKLRKGKSVPVPTSPEKKRSLKRARLVMVLFHKGLPKVKKAISWALLSDKIPGQYQYPLFWQLLHHGNDAIQARVLKDMLKSGTYHATFLPILHKLFHRSQKLLKKRTKRSSSWNNLVLIGKRSAKLILKLDKILTPAQKVALAKMQKRKLSATGALGLLGAYGRGFGLGGLAGGFAGGGSSSTAGTGYPPRLIRKRHRLDYPRFFRGWAYDGYMIGAPNYIGWLRSLKGTVSGKWTFQPSCSKRMRFSGRNTARRRYGLGVGSFGRKRFGGGIVGIGSGGGAAGGFGRRWGRGRFRRRGWGRGRLRKKRPKKVAAAVIKRKMAYAEKQCRRFFKKAVKTLRGCYQKSLLTAPAFSAKFRVKWTLEKKRLKVLSTKLISGDDPNDKVEQCIAKVLLKHRIDSDKKNSKGTFLLTFSMKK